jgi:hypothetical protein
MEAIDKDRFDALMKLAEFKSDIREKRQEIEWKISVAVWTLTAASMAYLRGTPVFWSLLAVVVLVVVHSWLWVRTNFNSAERDADFMYYFMDHASRIVIPGCVPDPGPKVPHQTKRRKTWDFLKHEPIWFEIAVTGFLGVAVVLISRTIPK